MKPKYCFVRVRTSRLSFSLATAIAALISVPAALAQSGTWTSTAAGPFNWSATTSWSGGTVATGVDNTASFTANITAAQTVNLDTARTIGNITFTDSTTSSHDLTISGTNTLTLDRTTGIPIVDVTQSGRILAISSVIAGSDGLQKNGAGQLTLSGANTYSGGTTLSAGNVAISNATSFGSGTVSVTGASKIITSQGPGVSLTVANDINVGAALTLQNPQTATGATSTFSGQLTGSSSITVEAGTGNGIQAGLAFTNANNTFTGSIIMPSGTTASTPTATGDDRISFASIGDGGTFTFRKRGHTNLIAYTGTAPIVFNTRAIALANEFGGGAFDGGGVNPINQFANNASAAANTVTFNTNIAAATVNSAGYLFFSGSNTGNNTFAGTIPNMSNFSLNIGKTGAGRWIFTGANSYSGETMIRNGTLSVNAINTIANNQPLGTGSVVQLGQNNDSGVLEYTGGTATTDKTIRIGGTVLAGTGGGTISNNGTGALTFSAANFNPAIASTAGARTLTLGGTNTGANTISGIIQNNATGGAVALTKSGAGTWVLSGANSYTGATTISAGVLRITRNTSLGTTAGGVTVASGSGLEIDGTGAAVTVGAEAISIAGGGVTLPTPNLGAIRNIAGNNTYGGTVTLTALSRINSDSGTLLFNNATAITGTQNLVVGGAGNVTIFGAITTNTGFISKDGAGTLILSGNNTNTGGLTVAAGTVQLGNSGALNSTAGSENAVTFAASSTGTLALGGNNVVIRSLTSNATPGTPTVENSSATNATLTVGNSLNLVSSYAGIIRDGTGAGTLSLTKAGTNTLTLSGDNSYTGTTLVTAGTLALAGSGDINSSSAITINGSGAKFVQSSSVAGTPSITLTQGTLTGSGTVGAVTVGDGTGGVISNNDGAPGASLNVGSLTFSGVATVNTFSSSTSAAITTTSLVGNGSAGQVTINPSAANWPAGTYNLISYGGGSITGAGGFGQFVLGTVTGASSRQTKTLGNSGTAITLTMSADDIPYWAGDGDGKWNTASTNNWKLSSDNSYTLFLPTDNVLFNDSATPAGPVTVDIDTANVAPSSTTFNNTTKDYVLSGAFGISSGSLTKNGTGTLTVTNANSYTGSTTINGGVLDLSADGAQLYSGATPVSSVVTVGSNAVLVVRNFGQTGTSGVGSPSLGNLNNSGGQVVIDGGTLRFNNETSARGRVINIGANGATLDVVNNSTYTWSTSPGTSVPFTGSGQTLTLTGDATSTGTINLVIGGTNVSLVKNGAATWTLGGTNTYTGNTTINAGTLSMTANRIASSPNIFIGNGATLIGGNAFTLTAGQNVTGTGATGFVITNINNSGLVTTGTNTISSSGTLTLSRLQVGGTGNLITGGDIQSGSSATTQRGLLVGNGTTGVLTITGGTFTSNGGGATNYDLLGNTASTGDGTLIINGGAYVNTANSGLLNLGNGSASGTLTLTSGSATINTLRFQAGTTGTKTSAIVNLDGGTLTVNNITVTSGTTRQFNFNGGQFTAGANLPAFSGLTLNVKNGGALINTNGFSFGISDPLLNNGSGGLTKSGLGTLTLSGANTYTGATSVNGGTLRFSSVGSATSDVTVATGAEAGALVATTDGQWINSGSLTLQNNAVALVDFGSTTPSLTTAPIKVANFIYGTTPGVKLTASNMASIAVGQTYPLATWTGSGPADGSAFDLRSHRVTGTFSVSSNTLFLTVTNNSNAAISWNTGNGNWDTATTNWVDSNLVATSFVDTLDSVLFGDATGASGNPVVTLASTVSPVSMTVNTTGRNYTVSGAGSISGSGALTLASTNLGTFTLATANNTFSGGTSVLGGTLVLGDATNTLSDTGAVTVDGASSVLSLGVNSDTVGTVSLKNGANISGSGTLTGSSYALESGSVSANLAGAAGLAKSTSGSVILSGANTFTGATTISGGTLRLLNTGALTNTSGISLTSGNTTIEFDTDSAFTTLPPMTGGSNLTHTIVSDRATSGAALNHQLGTMNFGASTFNIIQGANVASGVAGITFTSATMTSGTAGTSIINPTTATLAITGGVTSQGSNVARTLQLDGTGTTHSIGGVITQTVASALSVSKTNTSTWTLSGLSDIAANNYSGTTTIDQGTLAFTTTNPSLTGGLTFGAAAGSTNVGALNLNNVSATFAGAMTVRTNSVTPNTANVGSGQTLTINGGLTLGYDAGGGTGATNSNLTVAGAGSMAVNGTTINIGVNQAATNAAYWNDATLDVTGLAAFSTNVTNFNIGVGNTTQGPGTVLLSNTANTIIATTLTAGNTSGNNGRGTGLLVLGTGTNAIQADTIFIGRSKSVPGGSTGVVRFASQVAGSPGTVSIANKLGTGRANIDIANQGATATAGGASGNLDLRGHVATVSAETVTIGSVSAASNSGGPTGTLFFDAGTFDVNTLTMGVKSGASTSTARATVDIGGGTFTVNNAFTMGSQAGGGSVNSTVNLTGGTLSSNSAITKGTGSVTSTINLNGGILDMNSKSIGTGTEVISLTAQSGTLRNLAELNGGGALTKTTTGTLVLAGTNAYTGAATVNAGILSITGTLNPVSSLAVGGGTISFSGAAAQTVTGLTVNAGSSTVTNTNAGATNVLNVGAITRNAGGIVNFANATATNNVIQTSTANTNGILGPWAFVGSDLAMNDGTGNIVAYSSYTDVTRLSSGTKAIANNAASNVRIIEGTGTAGDITLAASGTTVVNTLLQSDSGGTGAANVVIGNGDTLQTNSMVQTANAGTLTVGVPATTAQLQTATAGGDLAIVNNSSNALRVNTIISDNTSASSLIITGSGSTVLTGVNTYSGTTTINAGSTLQLGDGTNGNDGSIANSLSLVNNGALVYNRFGSISYGGVISGTGSVTKNGTGTQTLNGANTYTGGTTVNAGTLALGTGGSLVSTGAIFIAPSATLENTGGTSQTLSSAITGGGTLLLSGAGQFVLSNAGNAFGAVNVTNAGRFIINTTTAALPAAATVAVSGGGILLTSTGASYANTITLGNNGGISTRVTGGTSYSNVTLPGTGTVTLNNDDAITTALSITSGQTLTGNLTVQVGGTRMTGTTASLGAVSLTGILTGSGGLTLTSSGNTGNALWGTGSLTLTGANDYTGGTTINQGTLTVGAGATLGASTGALSVNNTNTVTTGKSVVLNLASGVDTTVGSLSGAIATPTGGTNTATINNGGTGTNFTVNQTAAGTFAGVIAGQGNFVLGTSSTSTLTLTGAHTYTGTTTVAAGTLAFVGGSLASPITVSAGASLSFDTSATTTSTSTANISLGTIKITGTPSAASHTLFTAAGGITGTPVLHAPVPGYVLKVVGNSLVLEQAGYGAWAALNGAGPNLNDDHDNDGVPNGIEYFLGGPNGNTTGFTLSPGVTNTAGTLSVTWVMGSGYAGVYGTNFTVETSDTLTGTWTTESSPGTVTVSGSNVTYTFPAPLGAKKFARLKVTGP